MKAGGRKWSGSGWTMPAYASSARSVSGPRPDRRDARRRLPHTPGTPRRPARSTARWRPALGSSADDRRVARFERRARGARRRRQHRPLLAQLLSSHSELTAPCSTCPRRAGALATFAEAGISERATFVEGDFFAAVPAGYDLHLITAVLHDWGDDDCVRILTNCAAALEPGGRIVVVDSELQPGQRNAFAQATDALMLAYTSGGRERTLDEFDVLWKRPPVSGRPRAAVAYGHAAAGRAVGDTRRRCIRQSIRGAWCAPAPSTIHVTPSAQLVHSSRSYTLRERREADAVSSVRLIAPVFA
jgi:hypothetical protein